MENRLFCTCLPDWYNDILFMKLIVLRGMCMNREEKFEKMLQAVLLEYDDVTSKLEKLKSENKTKTVTYKQLMASKLTLQNIISRYEIYGLIE